MRRLDRLKKDYRKLSIKVIQEVADEVGGILQESYSGRGMYGKTCYGIVCDNIETCVEEANFRGLFGAQSDSMGKHFIVYWPSVQGE
jgi:hypothetical protein